MVFKRKVQLIAGTVLLSSTTFACNMQVSIDDMYMLYSQSKTRMATLLQEKESLQEKFNAATQDSQEKNALLQDKLRVAVQTITEHEAKIAELIAINESKEESYSQKMIDYRKNFEQFLSQITELRELLSQKNDEIRDLDQRYSAAIKHREEITLLLSHRDKRIAFCEQKLDKQKAFMTNLKKLIEQIYESINADIVRGTEKSVLEYRAYFEKIYEQLV
jgi:chromosome segregation ATPase